MEQQQDTAPAGPAVADDEPYASLKSILDAEVVRDAAQQATARPSPADRRGTPPEPTAATRPSVRYGLD